MDTRKTGTGKNRMIALACMLLAAGAANAGNSPDATVGRKLDKLGLKYEVDADGDYKLLFEVDGGRSQIVWVRSPIETLGGMRIREVLSISGKSPKPSNTDEMTDAATAATAALLASNRQKLGGWVLKGSDDSQAFYYVAQIPADLGPDDLDLVVRSVAKDADGFEAMLEVLYGLDKKDTY